MNRNSVEIILFDLGNVILPFNHYQIAEKLSRFTGKKEFYDPHKIFSYLFDFQNGAINPYETGKMSTEEFFLSLKRELGLSLSIEEFQPIWNEIFWENVEVSDIIRSLKGRKRLGLVSNTNPLHFDYVLSTFPILRVFDRWVLSHEVGYKKPAPQIFQTAIEWAGVLPEKILFIDDMENHVRVAQSLGIQGIHFLSPIQLKEELLNYGL